MQSEHATHVSSRHPLRQRQQRELTLPQQVKIYRLGVQSSYLIFLLSINSLEANIDLILVKIYLIEGQFYLRDPGEGARGTFHELTALFVLISSKF